MEILCLQEFKVELEKLKAKKSYKNLEQEIISYFFNKSSDQLCSGTRLNGASKTPYIKKRIGGSGGYRTYFLLLLNDGRLILMFLHPKTGPDGASNIDDGYKAFLYTKVIECIETNSLYELSLDETKSQILFKKAK